jgi:hypothetical protein
MPSSGDIIVTSGGCGINTLFDRFDIYSINIKSIATSTFFTYNIKFINTWWDRYP